MSTMTVATFAQNGSGFARIARDLVLDGKWREGLNFLIEGFDGMTYDIAIQILRGTHTISNDFNLIEELDEEYQADVLDIYCHNKFYEMNVLYVFDGLIDNEIVQEHISRYSSFYKIPAFDEYVNKYLKAKDQYAFNVTVNKNLKRAILAVKVDENTMPVWLQKSDFCRSAKEYALKNLPEVAYQKSIEVSDINESNVSSITEPSVESQIEALIEQNVQLDMYDKIKAMQAVETAKSKGFSGVKDYSNHHRQKVLDAIKERGVEWKEFNIDFAGMNEVIKYPYEVAVAYALSRTKLNHLTTWKAVSERELKLASDSSLHTDIWLALGFDLNGLEYVHGTREHNIFVVLMDHVQREFYPVGEFTTLNSADLDVFEGNVVLPSSKIITKNDILVIPTAGPEYEIQAMKAGLVISSVGSKLAHLVVVGREMGVPLIRVDNATNKFKEGMKVKIDFNTNTITASSK